MKEVTIDQLRDRLTEIGKTEEEIQEVIRTAKERSEKADAVYLNRRGTDRLFECTVVQCQIVDGIPHWFVQN